MNNNSHIHISFDLETMSLESDAAIVQIGATVVGSHETFNVYVDPKSSESLGARVDTETMMWWNNQDPELRKRVFGGTTPIRTALDRFANWCYKMSNGDMEQVYLWSRGADFDCVVLKNNYEMYRTYPFNFRNHRCVRTIMDLLEQEHLDDISRRFWYNNLDGQKHDALTDARYQAEFIEAILS